jgi:hypothetical protein
MRYQRRNELEGLPRTIVEGLCEGRNASGKRYVKDVPSGVTRPDAHYALDLRVGGCGGCQTWLELRLLPRVHAHLIFFYLILFLGD